MGHSAQTNIACSIIVPIYNEARAVQELYERLTKTMSRTGLSYELVFVDDGSTDQTPLLLEGFAENDDKVVVVELRRNFGKSAAYAAGFDFSKGKIIISMDGDLQHQPEDIPRFLEKIEEGYDVICSWRKRRVDNLVTRRIPSRMANWLASKTTGVKIHDFGGGFKAYKREIFEEIGLYSEIHRFIPALALQRGAKIVEIPIENIPRPHGKSRYGLGRIFDVVCDLTAVGFLVGYLTRPMYFFGKLAFCCIALALAMSAYILYDKFIYHVPIHVAHLPLAILAVMLFLVGLIFATTGLIGEVLCRIYFESTNKKIYSVRRAYHRENPKEA